MPIAFENGNRNKAVPVEDRSPSLAPSVTVTLEQSSLPDRENTHPLNIYARF